MPMKKKKVPPLVKAVVYAFVALILVACGNAQAKAPDGVIYINRAAATICGPDFCAPTLIGTHTALGEYPVTHAYTMAPGYGTTPKGGADVLMFDTRIDGVPLAIHRVWKLKPEQRRIERLQGPLAGRLNITGGCVNVMDDVYDKLVDCCSKGRVVILP